VTARDYYYEAHSVAPRTLWAGGAQGVYG